MGPATGRPNPLPGADQDLEFGDGICVRKCYRVGNFPGNFLDEALQQILLQPVAVAPEGARRLHKRRRAADQSALDKEVLEEAKWGEDADAFDDRPVLETAFDGGKRRDEVMRLLGRRRHGDERRIGAPS